MARIGVVGTGMSTAVGLTAEETAASVRSGVMRFTEIPYYDRRFLPFVMAEIPEEGLPAAGGAVGLTAREERLVRIAVEPLRECLSALPADQPPPPVAIALPETPTRRPLDGDRVLDLICAAAGGCRPAPEGARARGRAGGIGALGQAVGMLRGGHARFAVAGGVDSYRDTYVLGTLDAEGRVKSTANLDAFVPGEAASFLLLADLDDPAARGLTPLAVLSGEAEGEEPGHLYEPETPYLGEGLATVLQRLFGAAGTGEPVREVYSSMNGEHHWVKEWGVAFLRSKAAFADPHGFHHPADCLGDTGAAASCLMAGLAALGMRDGYRASPCLVYASSDRGGRAAVLISSP